MARLILGRRRMGVVASVLVAGLVLLCTAAFAGPFAGTSNTTQTNSARQQFAQHLLKTGAAQLMVSSRLSSHPGHRRPAADPTPPRAAGAAQWHRRWRCGPSRPVGKPEQCPGQ